MQTVRITPVVGLPQFTGWSQVLDHTISPDLHLVCALAIQGENAGSIGRDIVSYILETQIETAQQLYEFLEEINEETQEKGCKISISAGLFSDTSCFCAALEGTVLLKRSTKIGVILRAEESLALMEGKACLYDVFVFITQQAEQFLAPITLQFEKGFDADGVITGVVPAVHALEDSSLSAVAFVTVSEQITSSFSAIKREIPFIGEELKSTHAVVKPIRTFSQETPEPSISPESAPLESSAVAAGELVRRKSMFDWLRPVSIKLRKISSRKTYVDAQVSKKTYRWFIIATISIGGIAALIFFWSVLNRRALSNAQTLIAPFSQDLEKITAESQVDPIPAREHISLLLEDLTKLQLQKKEKGTKQEQEVVTELLKKAQSVYTSISGRDEFSELPIFYDLRLATPDFVTSLTTTQGDTSIFADAQKQQLIFLNLQTKQVTAKKIDTVTNLRSIAPWETEDIVLLANGIFDLSLSPDATPSETVKEGDSNRDATLITSFGPYVYVFNPEKRNIYRYIKNKDEYSEPVGWLQDPLGTEFTSVISFSIDGDVWLSTKQGEIKKFTGGKSISFPISGLPEKFENPIWLFTRENQANLYVLDPAKHRLVILNKQGQFIREIKSNSLASATTLFVDENVKKAFAVSGSIVYEIAL